MACILAIRTWWFSKLLRTKGVAFNVSPARSKWSETKAVFVGSMLLGDKAHGDGVMPLPERDKSALSFFVCAGSHLDDQTQITGQGIRATRCKGNTLQMSEDLYIAY